MRSDHIEALSYRLPLQEGQVGPLDLGSDLNAPDIYTKAA